MAMSMTDLDCGYGAQKGSGRRVIPCRTASGQSPREIVASSMMVSRANLSFAALSRALPVVTRNGFESAMQEVQAITYTPVSNEAAPQSATDSRRTLPSISRKFST